MNIIIGERGSGKTNKAVVLASLSGGYILTMNKVEADRVYKYAKEIRHEIKYPFTFDDFLMGRLRHKVISGQKIIIDNADIFLKSIFENYEIQTITMTEED